MISFNKSILFKNEDTDLFKNYFYSWLSEQHVFLSTFTLKKREHSFTIELLTIAHTEQIIFPSRIECILKLRQIFTIVQKLLHALQ